MNSSLGDGFPSDTGIRVDVVVAVGHGVGVGNPAHLSRSCPHVWGRHIQSTERHCTTGKVNCEANSHIIIWVWKSYYSQECVHLLNLITSSLMTFSWSYIQK